MKKYIINNWIYFFVGITALALLSYFISLKLIDGGRWGIGMILGGVDNWMNGGTFYGSLKDGISVGSIYSPGGIFLALLFRPIFGFNAETAIIICGGLFAILTFYGFAKIETDDHRKTFWYFIICLSFFFIGFPSVRRYLFEIHPDVPAIMFFVWGILSICKFLKSQKNLFFLFSVILFFFSGVFKANALFLFLGLGLYTVFSKKLLLKQKLLILISEAISGASVLIAMFSIDGCLFNSVEVMSKHPLDTLYAYVYYIYITLKYNPLYIALLLVYFALLIKRRVKFNSIKEEMWMSSATLWFLFGMYGTAKEGSNEGNIEASIIAFMPFAIVALVYIIKVCAIKYRNVTEYKGFVYGMKTILFISCILITSYSIILVGQNISKFQNRISQQKNFAHWLNSRYPNAKVTYFCGLYELLNNTVVNKKTDLHLVTHYVLGNYINDEKLSLLSQNDRWDVIITIPEIGEKQFPKTFTYFRKLNDSDYPTDYVGAWKRVDVYVRKN